MAKEIEKNVITTEEKMVKIVEKMENFIGKLESMKKKSGGNSRSERGRQLLHYRCKKKHPRAFYLSNWSSQDCMAEYRNYKNTERELLQLGNNLVNGKKILLLQKTIYVILHEKAIIGGNFSINGFNSTIDTQKRRSLNWKAGQYKVSN